MLFLFFFFIIRSSLQKSDVRKRNDSPANNNCIRTPDDLVTFLSSSSSVADSTPTKMRAAVILLVSFHGSLPSPLPATAVVNLVGKFAATPQLFSALPRPALVAVLTATAAAGPCASGDVSADVRVQFLQGLFTLSPGALNAVPKSVLLPVLGTITSPDMLNALPAPVTVKLITLLSLSRPLFTCLPLPTLVSLLSSVAARSPQEVLTALPPSTLFGFLDGLLCTVRDASPFPENTVPAPVLAAVFGPLMTSRMISVLPAPTLDQLLAVIGTSPELAKSLPVSGFVSVFGTLTKSPNLLSSLNPNHLAKTLVTVMATPSVNSGLPPTLVTALLDAVAVYLPSCFDCVPIADASPPQPDQK